MKRRPRDQSTSGSFGRLSTRIHARAAAFSRSYSPFIVRVNDREPAECRGYFNRLAALITIIRHAVAEAPAWVTVCGLKRDTPHLGHADTTCCALTSMYFKSRANTTGRNDGSTGGDDRSMGGRTWIFFGFKTHSRSLILSLGDGRNASLLLSGGFEQEKFQSSSIILRIRNDTGKKQFSYCKVNYFSSLTK